jgi:hypothetical protein
VHLPVQMCIKREPLLTLGARYGSRWS